MVTHWTLHMSTSPTVRSRSWRAGQLLPRIRACPSSICSELVCIAPSRVMKYDDFHERGWCDKSRSANGEQGGPVKAMDYLLVEMLIVMVFLRLEILRVGAAAESSPLPRYH